MSGRFCAICKGDLHHRKLWNMTPNPSDEEIQATAEECVSMFLQAYGSEGV